MTHSEVIFSGGDRVVSEVPINLYPIDSRVTPHFGAFLRDGASMITEAYEHTVSWRKPRAREPSIAEGGSKGGLTLLIHWVDVDGLGRGTLHVTGLVPQRLVFSPKQSARSAVLDSPLLAVDGSGMLRIRVVAASRVSHNFSSSTFCEIPLTIIIQNCDRAAAVGFTLELAPGPADMSPKTSTSAIAMSAIPSAATIEAELLHSGDATWLGCTRMAEQWLEPSGVFTLALSLAVGAAGTYTLGGFRLAVCGWRMGASADVQRPDIPLACLLPPARTVRVMAAV